jgi:GntR family transcriptional regulator
MVIRRRAEPLRYQIRTEILDYLSQEDYKPGDKIPTENELMDLLVVSRSTLREGLHLLEEEGILRTRHGTGRFLVGTPSDYKFDITRLQSGTEMLADYGIHVTTRVVSVSTVPADPQVAASMNLEPGARVLCLERIRYAENVAVICSIDILPRSRIPEAIDPQIFEGSLVGYLQEECGITLIHSRATIRAVMADSFINRLAIGVKSIPWILLEQVNYDQDGGAVIYSKDYHRSDYITFHVSRFRH